jgi:hypothetical protein
MWMPTGSASSSNTLAIASCFLLHACSCCLQGSRSHDLGYPNNICYTTGTVVNQDGSNRGHDVVHSELSELVPSLSRNTVRHSVVSLNLFTICCMNFTMGSC